MWAGFDHHHRQRTKRIGGFALNGCGSGPKNGIELASAVGIQANRRTRGHLLRAALEGVAFAVRQGLEALLATGVPATELRLAGGGSFDPRWRQLLADVLEQPLLATATSSASSLGAALLAGVGFGAWPDAHRVAALAAPTTLVATPGPSSEAYTEPYLKYRQLYLPIAASTF